MNINEIEHIISHLQKTCECVHCKGKYLPGDIDVIATTKNEGLFEIHCKNCKYSAIVTVVTTKKTDSEKRTKQKNPDIKIPKFTNRKHGKISNDDILDVKNFLINFDGNFKKIFTNNTDKK